MLDHHKSSKRKTLEIEVDRLHNLVLIRLHNYEELTQSMEKQLKELAEVVAKVIKGGKMSLDGNVIMGTPYKDVLESNEGSVSVVEKQVKALAERLHNFVQQKTRMKKGRTRGG